MTTDTTPPEQNATTPGCLPSDFDERVYAGLLGKVLGVYLGRPIEGWVYSRIQEELGDVSYYVHDRVDVPLIVVDDDISGTSAFLAAISDSGAGPAVTPQQIGEAWLNYAIEEVLADDGSARIIKTIRSQTRVLGEAPLEWRLYKARHVRLRARNRISAWIDSKLLFDLADEEEPLTSGGIGLLCEEAELPSVTSTCVPQHQNEVVNK